MRDWADERRKVVNKGFRGKRIAKTKPGETAKKPNETGVTLLSRYSFQNGGGDFGRLSKRWITSLIRRIATANVAGFSDYGQHTSKKVGFRMLLHWFAVSLRIDKQLCKKYFCRQRNGGDLLLAGHSMQAYSAPSVIGGWTLKNCRVMRSTFKVLFYLKRNATKKNGDRKSVV